MSSPTECKFWLEDVSCLFRNFNVLPNCDMGLGARLNALTWLVIVITLILLVFGVGNWWLFLLLGLGLVLLLYFAWRPVPSAMIPPAHYTCRYREQRQPRPPMMRVCPRTW